MPRKTQLSLQTIRKEVKRMCGIKAANPDTDDGFRAGVVLLSSLECGTNIRRIAKFTGYPQSYVATISKRLRRNKVWVGKKIHAAWFGENGGAEFLLDVGVALGFLAKT